MGTRELPPTGGGPEVMSAAGIQTPSTNGERREVELVLTTTPEAEEAGIAVVHKVKAACEADDYDLLAILRFFFDNITPRVPEFHALMEELLPKDPAAVNRIMRDPGSPGRPRSSLYFPALIEQVMGEQQGCTAKQAAAWLAENLERGPTLPAVPGAKRMADVYSELRGIFALWRRSLFVRAEVLTARPWRIPGPPPPRPKLVMTRLSQSVVFHLPQDTVTEGAPQDVEAVARSPQQPIEPDEPEQPGVPQRPSGKRDA